MIENIKRGDEIAIAYGDSPDVAIWAGVYKIDNGDIHFEVINGAWDGYTDGKTLVVQRTGRMFPCKIIWYGEAPFHNDDYNEAIAWLRDQIAQGITHTPAVPRSQTEDDDLEDEIPF